VKHIIMMLMVALGRDANEEENRIYASRSSRSRRPWRDNPQQGRQPRDLTVERAAEIIDELPSDVARENALHIVRGTLAAAGIEVSNLDGFTRAQVSELSSEIELARDRQKEFQEKTEETVRSLEEEIRKAREACDTIITEEEKRISHASAVLKEVRRVRAFFDFSETDGEENIGSINEDTQPLGVVKTRVR